MKRTKSNKQNRSGINSRTVNIGDQNKRIFDSVPTTAKTPPPPMPKKIK